MVAVFVVPKIHQKQEIVHRAGHEHYQMIIQDMRQLDIGYCINNIGGSCGDHEASHNHLNEAGAWDAIKPFELVKSKYQHIF